MSKILGINVSSTIVPFGSDDNVATHEAQYGKGGYRSVERVDDLDLIKESRLEEGMLVYVKEVGKFFQYAGKEDNERKWIEPPFSQSSRGLPVLTQKDVEELKDKVPEEYILVQDESDLIGEVTNHEVTTVNGTYLDILFRAIRKLQAEVARLKNTFELGINSYVGRETASTRILYDLEDTTEEEPLWAVQESELSLQGTLSFSDEIELDKEDVEFELDEDGLVVNISSDSASTDHYAKWTPAKFEVDIENLPDPKTFLYTTTNDKSVIYELKDDQGQIWSLSLKNILTGATYENTGSYSVLLIISKEITDPISGNNYGNNYVWIAIQDLSKDQVLFSGYIDPTTGNKYETRYDLDNKYYLEEVRLFPERKNNDTGKYEIKLSKFDLYSKYQDFSDGVDAIRPSDLDEIKYKAAHITIRSVETLEILDSILRRLQNNELVYVTSQNALYIIIEGVRHKIGSGGSSDDPITDTMTVQEILTNLAEAGVITISRTDGEEVYDNDGKVIIPTDSSGKPLDPNPIRIEFSQISKLSLINENNGETMSYYVDSEGNLTGNRETPEKDKFLYLLEKLGNGFNKSGLTLPNDPDEGWEDVQIDAPAGANSPTRGFIARINNKSENSKDIGLDSDRVKIGSFYSPKSSDTVFGCSHAYIELENSSQTDYYLDGCYLHYAGPIKGIKKDGSNIIEQFFQATYHIRLSGKLPAGGTYLIRGKQYANKNLSTTYIKVGKPDIEWYVNSDTVDIDGRGDDTSGFDFSNNYKKLIDLSYETSASGIVYGFALTYGTPKAKYNQTLVNHNLGGDNEYEYVYPYLIDSLNMFSEDIASSKWNAINSKTNKINIIKSNSGNSIYKNTFELDPAKQAYQSYCTKDSSRLRGITAADNQIISLSREYIQFPNSNDICPVSVFTPKASFEGKNVCTDKTQLDTEKPNMLTVSFGIDHTTTRCFNWISVGNYDEFVWVREKNSENEQSWRRFQSYWGNKHDNDGGFARKEFEQTIRYDYSTSEETFKKSTTIKDVVYANSKYKNIFPGSGVSYTSHKCILTIPSATDSKVTYEYLAGRSNSDGTPMEGHVTEIQTFNMYPESWTPVIYQVTDQQGFHWIEYQAWAAAAKVVNNRINEDLSKEYTQAEANTYNSNLDGAVSMEDTNPNTGQKYTQAEANTYNSNLDGAVSTGEKYHIIPVLLNTGDMTQNGTRINEWLDYYKAGYCLFDHLEQVNVVGNNDLGNIDETVLGTGDDPGKSNPHFYNICYCYEIPMVEATRTENDQSETHVFCPIFCGELGPKYIPSLYYLDFKKFRIFLGNSEITYTACENLFGSGKTNIYTGLQETVVGGPNDGDNTADNEASYTSIIEKSTIDNKKYNHYIYEILYEWMNSSNKKGIFACHEMPFTVVTDDNLKKTNQFSDRSISVSGSTGLVGSHCNRLYYVKTGDKLGIGMVIRGKGTYWLSRLLENFGIKYCIGGHKHTYACTWPVRENYYYKLNGDEKNSLKNGPMVMPKTLEEDSITFYLEKNPTTEIEEPVWGTEERRSIGTGNLGKFKNLTKFPIASTTNFINYKIKGSYSGESSDYINGITRDLNGYTIGEVVEYNSQLTGAHQISTTAQDKTLSEAIEENSQLEGAISLSDINPGNPQRNYVIYFMLQATGFKLKSNKELPGPLQKFSQIIPQSVYDSKSGWKPGLSQIYPMFAKIDLNHALYDAGLEIRLISIINVVPNHQTNVFNTQTAPAGVPTMQYFSNEVAPYGGWAQAETVLNLHF